jgi:glutathione peroxidase
MKIKTLVMLLLSFFNINCFRSLEKPMQSKSSTSIFDISYSTIDGKVTTLQEFKGKKILIVNVASKCGFTPQYAELEKLYETYKDKLVIVGFPANDFLKQEPGTNAEIAQFCSLTYGVTFPMAAKISVIGNDKHPMYKWLTDKKLNGWNDQEPQWNFCKYLIDENGELVKVFPSKTKPFDEEIINSIK